MSKTIDFIFDFGSPNAYFAYKVLPSIAAKHDAEINYIPCLLGGIFKATGNQAPMMAFGNVKGKLDYDRIEIMRFIEANGLNQFRMNKFFPVNTLLMMRGAIAAQQSGQLDAYITAGMAAMWEDSLKMDDPSIFENVMNEAGLDGAALLAQTQNPDIKAKLMANTEKAVARGSFGIPTFYIGDEMYFGKDRLGQIDAYLGRS